MDSISVNDATNAAARSYSSSETYKNRESFLFSIIYIALLAPLLWSLQKGGYRHTTANFLELLPHPLYCK